METSALFDDKHTAEAVAAARRRGEQQPLLYDLLANRSRSIPHKIVPIAIWEFSTARTIVVVTDDPLCGDLRYDFGNEVHHCVVKNADRTHLIGQW